MTSVDLVLFKFCAAVFPPQWGSADAEIKDPSVENTQRFSLFKLGAGPYKAINATPTARDFFLADSSPSGPFTSVFSKTSPEFVCFAFFLLFLFSVVVLFAVGNTGSCVDRQNQTDHLARHYRVSMQVPVFSARGI